MVSLQIANVVGENKCVQFLTRMFFFICCEKMAGFSISGLMHTTEQERNEW